MPRVLPIRPSDAPKACRRAGLVLDFGCRSGFAPLTPRAFSLIELVTVVAIVSIIAAIAVPRFGSAVNNYGLDAACKKIIADLSVARSQAMTTSAPQPVVFTAGSSAYKLTGMTSPDIANAGYAVDLSVDPYHATVVSASFGGSATVTFDMYGVPNSAGTVVVQRGSTQRTVTLDANTGKATSP